MSATVTPTPTTMPAVASASVNEKINTWGRVLVSVFVLALLLIAEVASFLGKTVDPSLLDVLKTLSTGVVLYWVGSSASSTTKQGQLASQSVMLANSAPPPAPGTTTTTSTAGSGTRTMTPPAAP